MTAPLVDVCVLSYGAGDDLATCVQSLAAIPGARLLLREHSADTRSLDVARDVAALPVVISHDPGNPGFARGMNVLAAEATAPWLLFLNPDAEVLSFPWPDQPSLPAGSLIGAEQFDSRGRPVRAYGRRYRVVDEMLRSWLRRVPEPREGTGFVGGAGLLIERQRFSTLGGFDERYFLFYEDVDLCLRAQAAGLPVRLERRFRIRHDTGSSARRNWDAALGHSYRSGRIFHEVYGHSLRGYDAFVAADAGARAVLWRTRGDRRRSRAYRHLAGRAAAALLSRHNTPAEAPAGWPT